MTARGLRVGVPTPLLDLEPVGGHGKVWHRILEELRGQVSLLPIEASGRAAGRRPRRRPEVVLADGHAELPRTALPIVAQIHEAGWFDPELRAILHPAFLAAIEAQTERSARAAAHVITPSGASRAEVIAHYGLSGSRVHAVPHGVDAVFTPAAPGGPEQVARARGGERRPYVLYAAALHPRKNLAALRQAMEAVIAAGLPHVLAVAGQPAADGSDVVRLEREARAELRGAPDRVAFLGAPSDRELAGLMAGAEVYCLPSLHEGFGITVLEAMACGAPVLVSDRGALPEVLGGAGVLVAPEADALAAALLALLRDPARRASLAASAAERARGYTWARSAAGWLEVLLAARAPRGVAAASRRAGSRT